MSRFLIWPSNQFDPFTDNGRDGNSRFPCDGTFPLMEKTDVLMSANKDVFIPPLNLEHIIKTMEGLSQTNKMTKE